MWWLLVVLLIVGGGCVVDGGLVGVGVVDGRSVGGDWKFLGELVGGCVVNGWVEFLCVLCLGFGMSFCVGGFWVFKVEREREREREV